MDAIPGTIIDHIDHDPTNNTISNLRIVTHTENMQNRKGPNKNSKTGIRGVCWDNRAKCWHVQVRVEGKRVYSSHFAKLEDAKNAAKNIRKKIMPASCESCT